MTSDQELKNKIAAVLYRADPAGLAVMGAPGDEYGCEAELIMDRLGEATCEADLSRIVANVFRRQFGYGTQGEHLNPLSWGEVVPLYEPAELDRMYGPEAGPAPEKFQNIARELWPVVND